MNHSLRHRRLLLYPHMRFSKWDIIHDIFNNPELNERGDNLPLLNNPPGPHPFNNPFCWHWRQEIRKNNPPPDEK